MKQTNWANWSVDDIFEFIMDLDSDEKIKVVRELLEDWPDLEIDAMELIDELRYELIFLDRSSELENLVKIYQDNFPGSYKSEFEFTERDLITYHLFRNNTDKVKERMSIVMKNPVEGVDNVTIRALFQLVFYKHDGLALEYARTVWKPILESKEIWGPAHLPFCMVLYLNALEEAWSEIRLGKMIDWEEWLNQLDAIGISKEAADFTTIQKTLISNFEREEIDALIRNGRQEEINLVLNIHFLKFMKERHNVPFILSDSWWNMLGGQGLFGKKGRGEGYFYISFERLTKQFDEYYDYLLRSNELEMFGRAFGIRYVYHFLGEKGLIRGEFKENMRKHIDALEYMFERLSSDDLWQMTYIFRWPDIRQFDQENRRIFASTFALDERDYEEALEAWLDKKHQGFSDEIKKNLEGTLGDAQMDDFSDSFLDLQEDAEDELPW